MLTWLHQLIAPFFDGANWHQAILTGNGWLVIISIVILECLLSVDNAVVLAAKTSVLTNEKDREKALFAGIWSAFIFRMLVVIIAAYIVGFWQIKVAGAIYLIYLSLEYFWKSNHAQGTKDDITSADIPHSKQNASPKVWRVALELEVINLLFSVDSVLASVAISPNPVIVLIGGIVGILAVRFIAEVIMKVMVFVPELEPMAYILIAIIAIKMFLEIPAIGLELSAGWFALLILVVVGVTLLIHRLRDK
ncbi:hypothetical protein EQG49_02815 [Periweissella cryptocerci]|uniref:DUF475 domain-containing protein n=1 Tax=Periweissella cryptocerci TaxID=2506420 RepID=A0A4P6YS58_9LACO|nr:hypothetical protein [Periweissella cryptocerci]QBO35460.1 hypothetical protein EQG49_02815 [Periweissella cryptocerci]